jgi:hypothetical protein
LTLDEKEYIRMGLLDLAFYIFCGAGLTLGPLVGLVAGWQLVKGPERSSEDVKFFALMISWILLSLLGKSYFASQNCQDFASNGYASQSECVDNYKLIESDPDAPSFRGD